MVVTEASKCVVPHCESPRAEDWIVCEYHKSDYLGGLDDLGSGRTVDNKMLDEAGEWQ